jgi:primary-amine oxidase
MPVQHIGFKLEPVGFFDRNPALDLPRSDSTCSRDGTSSHGCH